MPATNVTLSEFLAEAQTQNLFDGGELVDLIGKIAAACTSIAVAVSLGSRKSPVVAATGINVHGEEQKPLDVIANDLMLRACDGCSSVRAAVSEEMPEPHSIGGRDHQSRYLLIFDPLDGSSNIDVNVTFGTIFSVVAAPRKAGDLAEADFLQPGLNQVAAGFALYGPTTMIVLTLGQGVHGFTLDRDTGTFLLTHPCMRIPEAAREFAINTSNERFWEAPVQRYVNECLQGATGPRGSDFNMRWIASLVAEVFRILVRGGIFMYPRDTKDLSKPGRLRLLYEASPMAMIVEQAGGEASTGREAIRGIKPSGLHQRVPLILGSRAEVQRVVDYHRQHDAGEDSTFEAPLFNHRTLFRTA